MPCLDAGNNPLLPDLVNDTKQRNLQSVVLAGWEPHKNATTKAMPVNDIATSNRRVQKAAKITMKLTTIRG